jgi:hypothetical protein
VVLLQLPHGTTSRSIVRQDVFKIECRLSDVTDSYENDASISLFVSSSSSSGGAVVKWYR